MRARRSARLCVCACVCVCARSLVAGELCVAGQRCNAPAARSRAPKPAARVSQLAKELAEFVIVGAPNRASTRALVCCGTGGPRAFSCVIGAEIGQPKPIDRTSPSSRRSQLAAKSEERVVKSKHVLAPSPADLLGRQLREENFRARKAERILANLAKPNRPPAWTETRRTFLESTRVGSTSSKLEF